MFQLISIKPFYGSDLTAAKTEKQERLPWPDNVRAICMIAVVVGHIIQTLWLSGRYPINSTSQIVIYSLYAWHVPALFFLSGLNVQREHQNGAWLQFVKTTIQIGHAYLLWSAIQFLLMNSTSRSLLQPNLTDLLIIPLFPIAQLWFLWCLVLFRSMTAIFSDQTLVIIAFFAMALSLFGDRDIIVFRALYNIIFFAIGIFVGLQRLDCIIGMIERPKQLSVALFLIFSSVLLPFSIAEEFELYTVCAIGLALIAISGLCIAARACGDGPLWLRHIGQKSLAILVMHVAVIGGVRIGLDIVEIKLPVYFLAIISLPLAIGVPLFVVKLMEDYNVAHWFGLARWPTN